VWQPFGEIASGGGQSTSLEGDLHESGTLLVITDSPHIRNPMLSLTAGVLYMWSDNKVHEIATMCLPWQHWTKALV
jgi:hypothetical protein